MAVTMPVAEVQDRLFALLDQVKVEDEPVFIARNGQAEAVLLSLALYEEMLQSIEDLQDIKDMLEAETAHAAGEGRDFEEFVAELAGQPWMYRVRTTGKKVEKQIARLPRKAREWVIEASMKLREVPRPVGGEKLVDDTYRIHDEEKLVLIGKVERRKERTYKDIEKLF